MESFVFPLGLVRPGLHRSTVSDHKSIAERSRNPSQLQDWVSVGTTYAGYLEKAASVESKHRTSGYCFNAKGKPWAIKEVQDVMQAGLATVVDNVCETVNR